MSRVKHTKNELKLQRIALARYERYLPMLQLKKQQLQLEIQSIDADIAANERAEKELAENLNRWVGLFASSEAGSLPGLEPTVTLRPGNIAGVSVPVEESVEVPRPQIDLFATPPWFDDAIDAVARCSHLRIEREILNEKRQLVAKELTYTSQRVNLFEKVKIPECKENIRVIRIFLGDEQTAAVVRGKISKRRTMAYETAGR